MSDTSMNAVWAELRESRPSNAEALNTKTVGADLDGRQLLYGVDHRSDLHLLIPVKDGPVDELPADMKGLWVRHRVLEGNSQYLDMIAAAAHEKLFTPLVEDVLRAVVIAGRDPWRAVRNILREWQSAWKPISAEMTPTIQVGVFGELLTLERIMIPALGSNSIYLWSGPDSERHDFVGEEVHLEVKTTRRSRHEHKISRIDQLDVPAGRKLILISILLEQSVAGAETVASKMDQVVDMIRSDAVATDQFMTKMLRLGWTDELRRSGQLLRFHVRDAQIYEVNENFPRLPNNFSPHPGVVEIKYTIDLANIISLGVDEVVDMVRNT